MPSRIARGPGWCNPWGSCWGALLLANGGRDLLWHSLVGGPGGDLSGVPGGDVLGVLLRPDGVGLFTQFAVAMAIILPLVALLFERRDPQAASWGGP